MTTAAGASAAEPALAPPPGNPRFPLFDGLRAVAAFSILIFHVGFWSHMDLGTAGISPYVARLNVGVAIFFVISGFLLYRPFLAARTGDGPPVRLRDYARRRVLRIVPAYWVALTLLGLYPGLPDLWTPRWWIYYGFAQDYYKWTPLSGLDVAWTLGCEVAFYILLPFISLGLGWLAARAGRRVWWQLEAGVLGALMVPSTLFYVYAATHSRRVSPANFGATYSWFGLGMLLAVASLALERWGGRGAETVRRFAWVGWPVALGAYVALCRGLSLYSGFPFNEHDTAAQSFGVYALSGVVAVGLALPAAFERRPRSAIGRVLSLRPVAWLGLISYGIYLYHNAILTWVFRTYDLTGARWSRFLVMVLGCSACAVVAGALSYYLVERPFLRLKENPLRKLAAVRTFALGPRSSMSAAPERRGPS